MEVDVPALRRELGIPSNKTLIGSIGFLEERKGHAYLVEAFKTVFEGDPTVHLLIVGDGPCAGSLKNKIRELNLEEHVSLPGFVPGVRRFFPALDLFVFPSVGNECLPYVILDAMAAELPIVSTTAGGMVEEIEDNVCGVLVPPQDSPALASALLKLLKNREMAARFGKKARERVLSEFTLERMARETERFYRE
jgi:glycosyltransferase involved in cell wall biosynthesis